MPIHSVRISAFKLSALERRAFTLVELLVTIAVMALLAAFLFSAFSRVRANTEIATCQNNLKQIGLALELYSNDYNQLYPNGAGPSVGCSWMHALMKYSKTTEYFTCPANIENEFSSTCSESSTSGSYIFNGGDDMLTRLHKVRIKSPGSYILVADGHNPGNYTAPRPGTGAFTLALLNDVGVARRHKNGSNVVFVDGHVKWLTEQALTERRFWTLNGL